MAADANYNPKRKAMPQIKGPGTLQPNRPLKERMADIRRAVELGAITNTNTTLHIDPECANVLLEMFQRTESTK